MCKKIIEALLILLLGLCSLVLIFIFFSAFNLEKSIFVFISKQFSDSWTGLFFSGLLGSLISSVIMYVTISKNTEEKQMENQLKFRELFSEKHRWNIHILLSYIANLRKFNDENKSVNKKVVESVLDESYLISVADKEELQVEDFEMILENHIFELYDYMGIFEIADEMINNRTLDKKLFKISYMYRIESLYRSTVVQKELEGFPGDWVGFKNVSKILGEKWK